MSTNHHERHLEAQVAVLGSALIDDRCVGEILQRTIDSHYTGEYKTIFQAIKQLFRAGKPIDPVAVLHLIGKEYHSLVLQLMEVTPTAVNVREYIEMAIEESRLIQLQSIALDLSSAPTIAAARDLMAEANKLMADRASVQIVNMTDGYYNFIRRQVQPPNQIPWGIDRIDNNLRAEPGDLIIIGGYPSAGKTAFSLQLAYAQAKERKVGYFSLETNPDKLVDRIMTAECGINFSNVKAHDLSEEEWGNVDLKESIIPSSKLELIQAGGLTVLDIQAITLSRGFEVIYIDYLQLITPDDSRRSDFEQVSQISKALHTMSQTTGVLVVALSQLSRPDKTAKKDKAPTMSSLRQSGQIEQDADGIMLLYKEEPNNPRSKRILKVAKNKEGPANGQVLLDFDGSKQRFSSSWGGMSTPTQTPQKEEPEHKQITLDELPENEPVPFERGDPNGG